MGLLPDRPKGDPIALRNLAGAWDALGSSLTAAHNDISLPAYAVHDWWRGGAADTYKAAWQRYQSTWITFISDVEGMPVQLRSAADIIEEAQHHYDSVISGIEWGVGIVTVVGALGTIFTLGGSDGAAVALDGGIIATADGILAGLMTDLAAVGETISGIYGRLGVAVMQLQATLTPLGGFLLTGAVGAAVGGGSVVVAGDHNPLDIALASLFGFTEGADPAFGINAPRVVQGNGSTLLTVRTDPTLPAGTVLDQFARANGSRVNVIVGKGESDAWMENGAIGLAPVAGLTDIAIHGYPQGFGIQVAHTGAPSDWSYLSPTEFATFIKNQGLDTGPIRLIACNTGKLPDGAAQQLAVALGQPVVAPSDTAYIYPPPLGLVTGTRTDPPAGHEGPAHFVPGQWNWFLPNK